MEWFYIDTQRQPQGPYALEKLTELFRAGVIGDETLLWTKEMPDWAPAKTCQEYFTAPQAVNKSPDAQSPPLHAPPTARPEAVQGDLLDAAQTAPERAPPKLEIDPGRRLFVPEIVTDLNPLHPWRRYFARILDIGLIAVVSGFFLLLFLPQSPELDLLLGNNLVFGILIVLVAAAIESVLLAVFGTTFGKALYSIEVKNKNPGPIGFSTAFSRSFGVYLRGLGLGIPLISLFTMYTGYRTLKDKGTTTWDADNALEVVHHPIGYTKIAAIGLVWCLYIGAVVWGVYVDVADRSVAVKNRPRVNRESAVKQEPPAKRESPPPNAERVARVFIEEENRLRPTLPIKINDRLTLVGVGHAGNTMEYNLEIEFDPAADRKTFLDALKRLVAESTCAKPKFREAMKAGANFTYLYFEKTPRSPDVAKTRVAVIKVTAADCPQ